MVLDVLRQFEGLRRGAIGQTANTSGDLAVTVHEHLIAFAKEDDHFAPFADLFNNSHTKLHMLNHITLLKLRLWRVGQHGGGCFLSHLGVPVVGSANHRSRNGNSGGGLLSGHARKVRISLSGSEVMLAFAGLANNLGRPAKGHRNDDMGQIHFTFCAPGKGVSTNSGRII